MSDDLYMQAVLVWVHDQERFGEYIEAMGPVAGKYGGALHQMVAPADVYAASFGRPDILNVVSYSSKEDLETFESDPEFLAVKPLRTESINLLSVEGRPIHGEVGNDKPDDRYYVVEYARFGAGGRARYTEYEQEAAAFLEPFGYQVEWVIAVDTADSELPFQPDIIKVAYFENEDRFKAAHEAPGHDQIEGESYNAAVAESLWVIGGIHPAAPGGQSQ